MNKLTDQEKVELNKNFYNLVAKDFSDTRNKHYWDLFDLVFKQNDKEVLEMDDNFVFIQGNLRQDFNGRDKLRVLDIGCGNGRFAKFLSGRHNLRVEYLGIDNSENLLTLAKENLKDTKDVKAIFDECDITNIPHLKEKLSNEQFDLIVCIATLHHIPNKEKRSEIIQTLKEHLRADGKMLITTWNFLKNNSHLVVEKLSDDEYILSWKNMEKRYLSFVNSI